MSDWTDGSLAAAREVTDTITAAGAEIASVEVYPHPDAARVDLQGEVPLETEVIDVDDISREYRCTYVRHRPEIGPH